MSQVEASPEAFELRNLVDKARMLDSGSDAVIATDHSGRIVYWGAGAERLYGWARAEVVGRNVVDITPTSRSRERAGNIMTSLGSGGGWSGRFEVCNRQREPLEVLVRDIAVRGTDGRVIGVIGVSRPA